MGPNGSGKSTFQKFLQVTQLILSQTVISFQRLKYFRSWSRGTVAFRYLSFQYPIEIPGVSNEDFLRLAYNSKQNFYNKPEVDPIEFLTIIYRKLELVNMSPLFLSRNVNEGFSGGEKKKWNFTNDLLDSELSILDETDSGLDIDALKIISNGINNFMSPDKSIILITHYKRLLDYVNPDYVHVQDGKIKLAPPN
jgi:Fe-S cluster assembly ATP-binding protein